ncbi:hypothetical protein [Lacrimispora indolis]|uniref:hypothetical protein n=1 Tax=Lacrimispora indolis TaxID=69825 RepID=UPI000428A915|nr:hypothetical protein [[Clostridium] methoxybenzovorans]
MQVTVYYDFLFFCNTLANYSRENGITWLDSFKTQAFEITDEINDTFSKIKGLSPNILDDFNTKGWKPFIEQNKIADETLKKFLNDANQTDKSLAAFKQYPDVVNKTGKAFNFAALGAKAFNIALNAAIMFAVVKGIELAAKALDNYVNRVEKAKEAVADAKNNFDSLRSELQSINEELETNKDRISELNKLSSLTYIEQGELDKLKEATKELERQRDIKDIELKRAAEDLSESNRVAFDKEYGDNSFSYSDVKGLDSQYGSLSISPTSDMALAQEGLEGLAAAIVKVQEAQKRASESGDSEWLDSLTEREKYYKGQLEDNLSTLQGYRDNLTEIMDYRDLTDDERAFYDNLEQGIRLIYQFTDPSAWNQIEFDQIFNNESIDVTKEKLIELAQSGVLDEKSIDQFSKLNEVLKQTDFILEDGETSVSSFVNQIEALASSNDSLASSQDVVNGTFISEFGSLPIDKIEEYISLLSSGNITEKSISSFSELNDLMTQTDTNAEDAVKSLKEFTDGFTLSTELTSNIQDAYDLLKDVEEQYKKTGLIGLSSLESIANTYPQLRNAVNEYTQGLISADNMMSQLHVAYENDANAYKTAMAYKLSGNEEFFTTIFNNNQSLFDDLSKAYGLDVSNWKTMAQAKAEIDQKLIQSLSSAWSKYYNIVFDSVSGLASLDGMDLSRAGSHGVSVSEEQQKAWSEATKQANKYNQIIKGLNEAASIQIDPPDFGGIGSLGSKSGSGSKDKKDTKKPFDWIARGTKVLQDEYAKLEELASKDTIAYLGLTQEEFDNAKSIFDNGLGNSVEGLSQLQSYADKAGLTLGELYTMIQSGAPSASKENALQSMLQMQTDTLLPQYQREVEAYSKAYEDALKAIPSEYKDKIENGGVDIETLPSDLAEKVQAAIDANDKLKSSEKQLADGEAEHIETIKKLHENRIDAIDVENEKLQQSNKIIKSQMELMEARGKIVDADFYKRQMKNNDGLISNNQESIAEWESEMADLRAANFDTNSKEYKELKAKVRAAKNEIQVMKLEQEEFNQTLKQMPIDHLSTIISMYDDITAKIENWGSVQTATGGKLNTEYYQTLISNGATVIDQYKKQIREIKSLMSESEKGSTVWQELYSQLQSIDSATASMVNNLQKWNEELLKMPLDNISTYSDSLQKVISGLTNVQSEYNSIITAITDAISDQISVLEDQQKIAADAQQSEIDALQEKYDLLVKTNEKLKLQMALEQAQYNLARSLSQKVNTEVRNGEVVWVEDYDAVRKAQEENLDAQFNIDKYNLEQQIEDAKTALDTLNDSYQDQIDALEEISKKYSEISSSAEKISNANLATSLFGEGFVDKVLSGNDEEIYATLTSLYQTNAEQLEQYQKQADSTENIYSLLEDYIASYKAGEITYEQAMTKINGLLSQLNQSMSASSNLQNIYDYLGTVNGVGADADSILKGIQDGLSVTADELVKSLEEYNKNSGMISEYTSSWEQLTDNVKSMLDVLKEVRDNLRDAEDDSDDDDDEPYDKSRGKGWGIGDVNNGPGVEKYAKGVKNGPVGKASSSDSEKMIKYLATNELKKGEVPILAHTGEQILNEQQKMMLLKNFENAAMYRPVTPNFSNDLSNLVVKSGSQGDININYGDMTFPNVQNAEDVVKEFTKMTDQALRQVVSKYK